MCIHKKPELQCPVAIKTHRKFFFIIFLEYLFLLVQLASLVQWTNLPILFKQITHNSRVIFLRILSIPPLRLLADKTPHTAVCDEKRDFCEGTLSLLLCTFWFPLFLPLATLGIAIVNIANIPNSHIHTLLPPRDRIAKCRARVANGFDWRAPIMYYYDTWHRAHDSRRKRHHETWPWNGGVVCASSQRLIMLDWHTPIMRHYDIWQRAHVTLKPQKP